jgi:3-deoxy-D-manno-octulosonic acid kinase
VALASALPQVVAALDAGSLYEYASRATVRVMHGRAPVYAARLPDGGPRVVVRRSRHGGLLAPLTGDRFLGATRAPRELAMSLRLESMGIPTPTLVAYVVYATGSLFRQSDVATMLIEPSADLAAVLRGDGGSIERDAAIAASAALLVSMARGGVRHPDLNLKNILIAATAGGGVRAYLLDIDRARIEDARARAASANALRLVRSARKWRERHGVPISDAEVAVLDAAALGRAQ